MRHHVSAQAVTAIEDRLRRLRRRRQSHGQEAAADGISARSAAAIPARPRVITYCGRCRRSNTVDRAAPQITATLNGSRVAAASSGLRPSVFWRYRVTSVTAELVVAVLIRLPRHPGAARGPKSRAGSSGAPRAGDEDESGR